MRGSTLMLKLSKILVATTILSSISMLSQSANAAIEDELANICNIVKANDKSELRKKLKGVQSNFNLRLSDYYDGITCDGNSLIRTALLSDAADTGVFLVKKLSKSKLNEPEYDGMLLSAWIDAKGLSNSLIANEVKSRAS